MPRSNDSGVPNEAPTNSDMTSSKPDSTPKSTTHTARSTTPHDPSSGGEDKTIHASSSNLDEPKKNRKSLKEMAQENPTLVGDPVSLKDESTSSDHAPSDEDGGSGAGDAIKQSLKETAPNTTESDESGETGRKDRLEGGPKSKL